MTINHMYPKLDKMSLIKLFTYMPDIYYYFELLYVQDQRASI